MSTGAAAMSSLHEEVPPRELDIHLLRDRLWMQGAVVDKEGPYILEGAHRLGALYLVGVKHIPALVVLDLESLE